jgi:pimeloyl-ACP methyl ester carboxylesterase
VVAGTGVGPRMAKLAYSGWGGRAFALKNGGLGRLEDTYEDLAARLLRWSRDERFVIMGHSQGALHAARFATDFPHLAYAVVGVAGPYLGAPACMGPKLVPCAIDMAPRSDWLYGLRCAASAYEGAVTLVAGTRDALVPVPSALGLSTSGASILELDRGHTSLLTAPELQGAKLVPETPVWAR